MTVNVDNFVRVETAVQLDRLVKTAGGANRWGHLRMPTPVDKQDVIRMNRDTLYSFAVVDISEGATLTIPDPGSRYLSVMVVNEDHYINRILHQPGEHELTVDEFNTDWVLLAARIVVNPVDEADLAQVHGLQDSLAVSARSERAWGHQPFDQDSYDATREHLRGLAAGLPDSRHMFGSKENVDEVRHLLGTAVGWGGLPESEAVYKLFGEPRAAGRFEVTVRDVPVDAFWSISIYNRDGFFEPNPYDAYSVNSVTAQPNPDGSVTVSFGPEPTGEPNYLYVMDGWNFTVRFYRPRAEIRDGSWEFPEPKAL